MGWLISSCDPVEPPLPSSTEQSKKYGFSFPVGARCGGRTGSAEFAIGGAVNAALLNLTKVLADRGVADGVRVNAVNPGSILTERLENREAVCFPG